MKYRTRWIRVLFLYVEVGAISGFFATTAFDFSPRDGLLLVWLPLYAVTLFLDNRFHLTAVKVTEPTEGK